jgi:hypothetical protein
MIGFNGGLIGKDRAATALAAVGVWTLDEQIKARRTFAWPATAQGLLTTYPGASVAYSVRLLRDAYTGSLVTVRRASDNTTQGFTELQINDGSLASFCSGTDGFVATWHDQSGNANNATQATTSKQPQIVASGVVNTLNGRPCLTYGSAGTTSLTLGTRLTDIVTVFEVLKIDSDVTTANTSFLLGDTTLFDYHSGALTPAMWLDLTSSSANVRNGTNRLNNVVSNLTTTARTGNQTLISMIHSGTATVSQLTEDRTFGRSIEGRMQELILYATSQSADVAAISANINAYYSIY